MSLTRLQECIRKKKTPIAVGLRPEVEKIDAKILKNFENMYGQGTMATVEALRYHGTKVIEEACEKFPAVMIHAGSYLRYGTMGMDVLCNIVSAAKAKGMYVILGCATSEPQMWFEAAGSPDAVTILPYLGSDCCQVPEDKAVFALTRTCNPSSGEVQTLMMSGSRPLYGVVAQQMARHGAGIVVGTGYSLDVKAVRQYAEKSFLLLPACDGENAVYAFDDFGHGAMVVNFDLQYSHEYDKAIKEMKQWVIVA